MATNYDLYKINRLDGGLVTDVSPSLLDPQEGFSLNLKNLDLSIIGIPKKRPGKETVLASTGKPVKGAHQFIRLSEEDYFNTTAVNDGNVLVWDGDSWYEARWVVLGFGMANTQMCNEELETAQDMIESGYLNYTEAEFSMTTFADHLIVANGVYPGLVWDGKKTGKSPKEFPVVKHLETFRTRLVAAGHPNYPSRLYLSHTGDPTIWDPWRDDSNAFDVFVSPDDGQKITGILSLGQASLLIGKAGSLYEMSGHTRDDFTIVLVDPNVGVASHKSMVYISPYGFFISNKGIYRYNSGQVPERISTPIQNLFEEHVDTTRINESRAFLLDNINYVAVLPKKGGGSISFVYNTAQESWAEWDNPSVGEYMKVGNDPAGEVYYVEPEGEHFFRFTPGKREDEGSDIHSMIETQDLDAEVPEVEKDFGDLYLNFFTDETPYEVSIYLKLDNREWIPACKAFEIPGNGRGQQIVRVPVGKTARFLRVRIENHGKGEEFSPISLMYTFQAKDVL